MLEVLNSLFIQMVPIDENLALLRLPTMIVTKLHNESFGFRFDSIVIVEQVTNGSYPPCD